MASSFVDASKHGEVAIQGNPPAKPPMLRRDMNLVAITPAEVAAIARVTLAAVAMTSERFAQGQGCSRFAAADTHARARQVFTFLVRCGTVDQGLLDEIQTLDSLVALEPRPKDELIPDDWENCPCGTCARDPDYCETCEPLLGTDGNEIRVLADPVACEWIYNHLAQSCPTCHANLPGSAVKHYNHPGGWIVRGYRLKQWVYVECGACGAQWSISKLGIAKDAIVGALTSQEE